MLDHCLKHYGIDQNITLSRSLHQLYELNQQHYCCGYCTIPAFKYSISHKEAVKLLAIQGHSNPEAILKETFRYGVYFGLIKNLTISPTHSEWSLNPLYQRDLFFTKLKLQIRECHRKALI